MTETTYRTEAVINGELSTGTNCSNCGVTYAACTKRVLNTRSGRACCHECQNTDTHDVQPRAATPGDPMNAPTKVAMRQLQGLYAECAAVGLPYDAAALVRHHRANAALAATADAYTSMHKGTPRTEYGISWIDDGMNERIDVVGPNEARDVHAQFPRITKIVTRTVLESPWEVQDS